MTLHCDIIQTTDDLERREIRGRVTRKTSECLSLSPPERISASLQTHPRAAVKFAVVLVLPSAGPRCVISTNINARQYFKVVKAKLYGTEPISQTRLQRDIRDIRRRETSIRISLTASFNCYVSTHLPNA